MLGERRPQWRIGYWKSVLILGVVVTTFFLGAMRVGGSEETYVPSMENLEARRWFQDAKFGDIAST